jgi:hypothetical protein
VKKAAASGGPSSSEQGSIWLVVEAPVDNGSGSASYGRGGGGGETGGGRAAAPKPWARQSSGGRCPSAGRTVGRLCSDRVTDRLVPRGF